MTMITRLLVALLLCVWGATPSHGQTQICYVAGKNHVATWEDKWLPGMPQRDGFWTNSLCPNWAGKLPASASTTGKPQCYASLPVAPLNVFSGFGKCRQQENVLTQECHSAEVCLDAMKNVGTVNNACVAETNTAVATWAYSIDCSNVSRKWRDNWGGTWYLDQVQHQRGVSGWIDTSTSYSSKAKCGWWRVSGSKYPTGFADMSGTFSGTKVPQKSCLTTVQINGTVDADKLQGSFRNSKGLTGPFNMYSIEPPPGFTWFNWNPTTPATTYSRAPWETN
jgi:hypothetical protein